MNGRVRASGRWTHVVLTRPPLELKLSVVADTIEHRFDREDDDACWPEEVLHRVPD
jgi:hypothetical protein